MQITNGQVEYEHPHKVADFQIPKAKVTLSFVLDAAEDVEAAIAHVGAMARARAVSMATGAAVTTTAAASPTPTPKARKTPPVVPPAAPVEQSAAKEVAPTPAAAVSDTSNAAPTGATPSPAADPRLTDKGLQQAIQAKLERSIDRQLTTNDIRGLVREFTGDAVKQIYVVTDPATRAEFLHRLGEL